MENRKVLRDSEALGSFEMISHTEARVRTYIGFAIWISAVAAYTVYGIDQLPPGAWVAWLSIGVVIHRMGKKSQ
jgi:hypothetical protein